jgi:hypothetical protein
MFLIQLGFKAKDVKTWSQQAKLIIDNYGEMSTFDIDYIDPKVFQTIFDFCQDPQYSYEIMKCKSLASAELYKWLKQVNEYQGVAPAQKV